MTFDDKRKGFTMDYGKMITGNVFIEDIALVEGSKHNLLTVSQFIDKGFKVDFEKRYMFYHLQKKW